MAEPKEKKRKVYITWESGVDSWRETYQAGDVIRLPQAPTRNGYDFKGWWTKPREGGEQLSDEDVVEGNETYFARWRLIEHSVTLLAALPKTKEDDNTQADGSVDINAPSEDESEDESEHEYYDVKTIAVIKVPHGSSVVSIPDVERLGCEFIGWFYKQPEDEGGKTIQLANDYRIVSDMEFHAHFEPIKYDLTLNAGEDAVFPDGRITQYTVVMTPFDLPIPMRRKWSFGYWYATGDASQTPVKSIPVYTTGNLSYTAKWETGKYLVVVKVNGSDERSFSVRYGETIADRFAELQPKDSPGTVFKGWRYYENGVWKFIEDPESWTPERDITIEALVVARQYTVNIHRSWEDAVDTVTVEYGNTVPEEYLSDPPEEANAGQMFIGWWTEKTGGRKVDGKTRITSDLDLWPLWQDASGIGVTMDANQGTFDWMTMNYPYGTIISAQDLPTPTRLGYNFNGWWYKFKGDDSPDGKPLTEPIEITKEVRIYAQWAKNTNFVVFHSNGGLWPKINIS